MIVQRFEQDGTPRRPIHRDSIEEIVAHVHNALVFNAGEPFALTFTPDEHARPAEFAENFREAMERIEQLPDHDRSAVHNRRRVA